MGKHQTLDSVHPIEFPRNNPAPNVAPRRPAVGHLQQHRMAAGRRYRRRGDSRPATTGARWSASQRAESRHSSRR
ncbi:hypothetical protein BST34_19120 [Mycolicibacterium monacense DSM 44395]|uniref:Uncharacterized protein n=1 Tax=Mycobacterium sp. (strain JLS) TaxID=164757 RepID=A0A5Q5CH55_MYCSJ|nr:hypothetical protein BST34_19120 [Mycolicibacterium monacense DSM 44395]QHP86641.1 hypothetical protein EWR22_15480 [Mycolicibacterium monacense DSM 44395]